MARNIFIVILLGFSFFSKECYAQKKIEILHTDSLMFDKTQGNVRKLYGNVQFKHEGSTMNCDSALFYPIPNIFHAYSNVKIFPNDTVTLVGDSLHYFGNEKMAKLYSNVELYDNTTRLTTSILEYDLHANIAYYFGGGFIKSKQNTLKSRIGKYFLNTKTFMFKDSVEVKNDQYTIKSDTLNYEVNPQISSFFGPTTIVSDSNTIYCENGWYNSKTNQSQFGKNAWIKTDGVTLWADSLSYDRNISTGIATSNAKLFDSVQNMYLNSNYMFYRKNPELCIATDSVLLTKIFEKGDSLFMHSDSIICIRDSADSAQVIKAWHKVRYYKNDVQGKCDSIVYNTNDSIMEMHREPVIWSEEHQISGETIKLYIINNELNQIAVNNAAFLISEESPGTFNQVKGRDLIGYIKNNVLYRIDITRNGETIYHMRDDKELIGINKATCANITVFFEDGEIAIIDFKDSPSGTLYPPGHLSETELKLTEFKWLSSIRPTSKTDIFVWQAADK